MANYRYKTAEIEAMKKDILTHCESETTPDSNGNKSAWRLRLILEGMAMCCRCSKREEASRYRKLALFERLTTNDMPNWSTEPTQSATAAETPQISTESAETVNVSGESEKESETAKYRICRYAENDYAKITVGDRERGKVVAILLTVGGRSYIEINDEAARISTIGQKPLQITKPITALTDAEVLELIYAPIKPPEPAPQSRKTARTANYATPIPKAREIARKRHCRRLGANGYAMLDDAAATLAAINTPRHYSANSPPIGSSQLISYW